jgi:hypothetical protein
MMCSDGSVAFASPLKVSRMGLWPLAHLKRNYNPSRIGYPMSKHLRAFIFRAPFCTLNTSAHRRTWQHCPRGPSRGLCISKGPTGIDVNTRNLARLAAYLGDLGLHVRILKICEKILPHPAASDRRREGTRRVQTTDIPP